MAYKDIEKRREWHNERAKTRRKALTEILGNKCVKCEANENLQFDHIDPKTKSFALGPNLFKPWSELLQEIEKCQLLCSDCHEAKSLQEQGGASKHGELSKYTRYKCRCGPCTETWNSYHKEYKRKKRGRVV